MFYYEVSHKLFEPVTTDDAVGRCDWIQGQLFWESLAATGLPEESLIGKRAFLRFLPPHALPTFGRDRATCPRSGCLGCGPTPWLVCVCSSEATKEFEIAKMGPIPSLVASSHVGEGQYLFLSISCTVACVSFVRSFAKNQYSRMGV